jgi:hypothetical protein
VRAVDRKLPLKAEVPRNTGVSIRRDDRNEQGAGLDLLPDRSIPRIATPQLALIEPDFDTGRP